MQEASSQEPAPGRFLLDIVPLVAGSNSEDELVMLFTKTVSSSFGIDSVSLSEVRKSEQQERGALLGYMINTKKPYVDNQLSEYSAFPELIAFKNKGFKSCAVLPLVADGRVVSTLELLSKAENKFSEPLVREIGFGASLIGFVLMYKGELSRSIRLATYFDAVFNNQFPQLIVSEDGSVVKYNKAAIKQFALSVPEGRKVQDILKLDFQKVMSLTNGTYANIVLGERGASGKVYAVVAGKINDKLAHIAANDITEQFIHASMVNALSKSKDLCILFADASFTIVDATPNSERMFGYSNGVLVNGNLVELAARQDQNDFRKSLESLEGENVGSGAVTFEFANTRKYFRYISSKFLNGYMVMFFDASYEKQARDVRDDLDDFLSSSTDIVLRVDGLGYVQDCNLPAESVLGFRKEEIIGKGIKNLYAEQDILDRDINYVRNGGKVDNSFINLIKRDGTAVPATHSVRLAKADAASSGQPSYLIVVKELATKRKLSEQEAKIHFMENQAKRGRMESDLKSQFIYNISHELKTPLTNIKGYSKLLYDGEYGTLTEQQKDFIQTTLEEADRLLKIIQQILDAAKLEAEKVKLEPKEVDLNTLGNNPSIKALEEAARSKGLSFEWKVAYDVPKINADPNRLIQVFVNLIGNSIKFTEKGGITVRITRKSKNSIECKVTDTGIGISEDDKKKLFRRKFYEAQKRGLVQQPGAGTGLGLSIVRDLVKLHGGRVSFDSKQGEGSSFWFTLPITQKQRKKEKQQEAQQEQAPASTIAVD